MIEPSDDEIIELINTICELDEKEALDKAYGYVYDKLEGIITRARKPLLEQIAVIQLTVEDSAYAVTVDTEKTPFTEALNEIYALTEEVLPKEKEENNGSNE